MPSKTSKWNSSEPPSQPILDEVGNITSETWILDVSPNINFEWWVGKMLSLNNIRLIVIDFV